MDLDDADIVILLSVTLPFICMCFVCLCGFYCKNRKTEPRQNNSSSQHESHHPTTTASSASYHGYTRNHSSPSPASRLPRKLTFDGNTYGSPPGTHTDSSFRTFRDARHDTESASTTSHDGSDGYMIPEIPTYTEDPPKDLFPGNSFYNKKALPESVPRIPSSAKPYSKSSTRVHSPSQSGTRGELPPQPPTPGCLPPQPPTPGCLPPQPPTPGCLPPQPPTPGYLPPQPPSTDESPVRVHCTSPCSIRLKPQCSFAEELPIPPSTQPPTCHENYVITNGEGTVGIRIVFPRDQDTPRNPSQTPLWQRPVTQAFLEINKLIKIKVKTNG
ncbi:extensin-like [Penaeus japonicus]|uniref:extensin-like n=1 Tax=Penaeus japonicus TaxID=27405 RepID=UPI001C70CE60|nr:extensin-like [Penaeus japonicus]